MESRCSHSTYRYHPVSNKELLDIQAVREGRFTLNTYVTWSKHTITAWDSNNTRIVTFCYSQSGRDQASQIESKTFAKIFFALKLYSMYVPYVKNIFNRISDVFLLLAFKILKFFFVNGVWKNNKRHSLKTKNFQKCILK